jgi:hypothetical protein
VTQEKLEHKIDRSGMARLDIDTPIENQPMRTLVFFALLGFIPLMFKCFAEVADECLHEIDRRRGK